MVSISDGPLGGRVQLNLEAKRTVLVGHNGAGKSLFLESLNDAANLAVRRAFRRALSILSFSCEIRRGPQRLNYLFERVARNASAEEEPNSHGGVVWDWTERCVDLSAPKEVLWKVENGIATVGGQEIKLEQGIGLLAIVPPPSVHVPDELLIVRNILGRVRRVSAGVPRRAESRTPLFLMREPNSRNLWFPTQMHGPDHRVEFVARNILNWYESDRETFNEYDALGRRLKLWSKLQPTVLPKAVAPPTPDVGARDVGILSVDKVNFGCLSDGTLRAAEILVWLVSPMGKVLLIEEPETSIHPGLLRRLLNEVDSYSLQRQVVVSTHSPDVVSQSQPNELRLVRRVNNTTFIEPLSPDQFARLKDYLCDDGTLGEFMFGGGGDD
jgi:energy-coupling factor transporter ATP-binding protein EcfA2